MPRSSKEERERLREIGRALRRGITAPTDTLITGDIPLLLTRLSQVPRPGGSVPPAEAGDDDGANDEAASASGGSRS